MRTGLGMPPGAAEPAVRANAGASELPHSLPTRVRKSASKSPSKQPHRTVPRLASAGAGVFGKRTTASADLVGHRWLGAPRARSESVRWVLAASNGARSRRAPQALLD